MFEIKSSMQFKYRLNRIAIWFCPSLPAAHCLQRRSQERQ